ncbi:MAG TPA: oxygenase MpaB family protein [Nocardioides sp.]|uniref:oxygenase MpaB family protein n=1 Tax=Nocardioides sp. TaxID=35761 RepID=UPI002BABA2FF|nr:oxygenase MpaB family protein [Nocardioides sp.]HQR27170.1 oxygenase MpaB family protein [Nocardioides sp.]
MTSPAPDRDPPTSLRRLDEAQRRHGERARRYLAGMWRGDPLADAFVADFPAVGHGRAMRMLRQACREGITAVPEAPDSLTALFGELDRVPGWVDLDSLDHDLRHLARYTRQAGIVLGAASLVAGYANSAASRPLQLTGRYVESAGVRTIEVASWLVEINARQGLARFSPGFELTVRVRVIHALVRQALRNSPDWDETAWGVPVCQSYLAYTLVEFCLIPLRGMRAIGAPYLPHEVRAQYHLWRYAGHLLGIEEALLPVDRAGQEALEDLYLLTRPEVDAYCRDLVRSINQEFLVPEIEELVPARLAPLAPTVVHGLERVFLGDAVADELAIPRSRATGMIRRVGPVLGAVNATLDRLPGLLEARTERGRRYRVAQDRRLRERYAVQHDLVDASPAGGRDHPARVPPG